MYAVNDELQKARRLFEGELFGPESFAVDNNSKLYHHKYIPEAAEANKSLGSCLVTKVALSTALLGNNDCYIRVFWA